jgi:hypothetical protein
MRDWLATRKNTPRGTADLLAMEKAKRRAAELAKSIEVRLPEGAQNALRRLEQAEASAYAALQTAMQSGDLVEIKAARDGWLRVGDALRKYDLAVEAIRRDAGELMPRKGLETMAHNLMFWIDHGLKAALNDCVLALQCGGDPVRIWTILDRVGRNIFDMSVAAMRTFPLHGEVAPAWLVDSAIKGHGTVVLDWPEHIQGIVNGMERAYAMITRDGLERDGNLLVPETEDNAT